MTKSSKINQRTTQENPRSIKNNSRVEDKSQEEFNTQEESQQSRIKIQDSRHDIISMFNYMAIAALVG